MPVCTAMRIPVYICIHGASLTDTSYRVFDPPEDNPVQRFSRNTGPAGKRVKDQTFGFDRVFDENTTQGDVYEATTKNLLDQVMDGYNATVFAYGATGCGKTHTITGTSQMPGIIFLTMQELFEKVDEVKSEKESEITLSYLEIYNETIRDLLNPGAGGKQGLMLREDASQAVSVAGLSSHHPQNVAEVMDMVIRGNSARTQSPTEANATSSRSHAVLQVNVSLKSRDAAVNEPVTMATLSIIDLAGSERASATKNRGERLLEGANINKSLLALGSCINALCDPRKKNHVPYRNSKLTRLLKFSLGGNCRTVMIVCVSPSSQHFDETQNTLRYANRAKNIQTKSVRNVYNVDRHVKDYLKKIDEQMNRINELTAQQKQYEEMAFVKFRKTEVKRAEVTHDGLQRIRAAYDHSAAERQERVNAMKRLRQVERRIGAISGWIGAFDQVCETREDEEPPKSMVAMRKTASGILVELEGSRQHYHQRLGKNNWCRAIDTALQDGLRQLQGLEGSVPSSPEEASLRQEVELLKGKADIEAHMAVLDVDKGAEQVQALLTAHFETIAILNQILQMSEEEAVQAARDVLGKLLQACNEAVGQVIKPDLQITEAVPPSKAGTPRKRRPLAGPSPSKSSRQSLNAQSAPISAVPQYLTTGQTAESSPVSRTASPRRRVKLGGARKAVVLTPRKKSSPVKKRAVRWKDEDSEPLVEFQATPKYAESSPTLPDNESSTIEHERDSTPPTLSRFATGFLSKKNSSSPLREMQANSAPRASPTQEPETSPPSTDEDLPKQLKAAMQLKRSSSGRRRSPGSAGSPPPTSDPGIFSASHARRMVRSEKEDSLKAVLSPRTAPVVKDKGGVRRSLAVEGTPREGSASRQHVRVSSIVPGSGQRSSSGMGKAAWR